MPCVEPTFSLPDLPAMELTGSGELHELWHGHLPDPRQYLPLVNLGIALPVFAFPRPHRKARRS